MWISNSAINSYLSIIEKALSDVKIFSSFKSQRQFSTVVGVSESAHALHCYKKISNYPDIIENIDLYRQNDLYGAPLTSTLGGKKIGNDTCRFLETLCYLKEYFGNINNKSIFEFGSNYGGLCFCLLQYFKKIQKYYCIDLDIVQQLQEKYYDVLGYTHDAITYYYNNEPIDICISEYALTEFTDDDLYNYYEQYCKNVSDGFLLRCNIPEVSRYNKFITTLNQDFELSIIDEPLIRIPNKIIIGRKN